MAKHPAEVFGYPLGLVSSLPKKGHKKHWCPFADNKCNKQSRLIRYPMGVCSVQYGDETIALVPGDFCKIILSLKILLITILRHETIWLFSAKSVYPRPGLLIM